MLLALPSLRFQPKSYSGGVSRFYLPLFYDLVALRKPARVVILGFGDGQPHFTFCQAIREHGLAARCLTIRRAIAGEDAADDAAWQKAVADSAEIYRDVSTMIAAGATAFATEEADGPVDLLLIDDCDSYQIARGELLAWQPKLAMDALVLFHGLDLERTPSPRRAWEETAGSRARAEFHEGIGLGVAPLSADGKSEDVLSARLFGSAEQLQELAAFYSSVSQRIDAENRALEAERKSTALELRQVWLDTVLADRWKAQQIMDAQAGEIADRTREKEERTQAFGELHRDRMKAQLIMDTQTEQLKQWVGKSETLSGENKKLKAQLAQEKRLIAAAKKACRKRGRCFGESPEEKKQKRSIPERVFRELRRIPGNLSRAKSPPAPATKKNKSAARLPLLERYPAWIAEHEPDAAALARQREASRAMKDQPAISLLLPTFNPPGNFLDELIASISAQTYGNFEICVADGGSNAAAKEALERWREQEPRVRLEFLPQNLGIAENTNRALALASGDFFTCIDQDDLLAPFALYELACAMANNPGADIFYSDEDRLGTDGKRHSPFFKPEWSPEFLLSSMYLGHLTAYRRTLVDRVGGFRKEFDLSQDYDFALRATERARAVCHVPHVLYHWREHPASGSAGGKPEARATNLAALADAMRRRGLAADVLEYPTANRARFQVNEWPKVSIIVPTDSPERARACAEQLPRTTVYPDYEIVIVTNSRLADALEATPRTTPPAVRFVRYDQPFNFSDKSNVGARAATGSRIIFFNDDVASGQPDWIQNLIEPLENPEVGAVAPKLLYETGKIQHAGLVTGVRGLVGTACHQWPGDSTDYTNFAQSMRDVSALSAACLAMRREDFFAVGEFDAVNTRIAHSDLDLCFKVRSAGMRCVYTPFVTMSHCGHASIGAVEEETKAPSGEKASVFLLRRWPEYTCHDPYYPDNVRDWLYADSPTPIRMWAPPTGNADETGHGRALLFVSHDLSWSGAPLILLQVAKWCRVRGFFVVLMSPQDGPLREKFVEAGVPVIADPLITKSHPSFAQFAREFDCVIASTIFAAPIVRAAKAEGIPHLWWIHEGRVAEHYLGEDADLRLALAEADLIVTPDTVSAQVYQPFTEHSIRILPYGISDPVGGIAVATNRKSGPVSFLLLGTIEHRKGQRVLLEALRKLPAEILRDSCFRIVGRPHDVAIAGEVQAAAKGSSYLIYGGSVSHAEALALIRDTDVMMSCSWDETGPLILMEALAFGKPILSTSVGTVGENLTSEEGGLFFRPGDARALAAAIARLVREPDLLARLQRNARASYDKHFAFPRFGEGFETLVHEAIASSKAGVAARA